MIRTVRMVFLQEVSHQAQVVADVADLALCGSKCDIDLWHVVSNSFDNHFDGNSGLLNISDIPLTAHRAAVSERRRASVGAAVVGGEGGTVLVVVLSKSRLLVLLDPLLKIRELFLRNGLVQRMVHSVRHVLLHEIGVQAQIGVGIEGLVSVIAE